MWFSWSVVSLGEKSTLIKKNNLLIEKKRGVEKCFSLHQEHCHGKKVMIFSLSQEAKALYKWDFTVIVGNDCLSCYR